MFRQVRTVSDKIFRMKCDSVRTFWTYVNIAFNRLDAERLKQVGPDRLCAEWILKNGGAVRYVNSKTLQTDYNLMPPESSPLLLREIDASNSSIMALGLDHLNNCNHIERIIFHNCTHLEENGLDRLPFVQNSLKELQISHCLNFNATSLNPVKELTALRKLSMFDLPGVDHLEKVRIAIKSSLNQCHLTDKPLDSQ